MKVERDKFDDLFRSKLEDFEMDTLPGDWEAIADRLPEKAPIPFRRTLRYWAAAAVASLLMVTAGMYMLKDKPGQMPVAQELKKENATVASRAAEEYKAVTEASEPAVTPVENTQERLKVAAVRSSQKPLYTRAALEVPAGTIPEAAAVPEVMSLSAEEEMPVEQERSHVENTGEEVSKEVKPQSQVLIADAAPIAKNKQAKPRRWGFGMGGGGLSVGADNTVPQYMMRSAVLTDDKLAAMNSPFFNEELPKTDVHHHIPISFGLSASYYLNKRFSLQLGVNYSYLYSDWATNGEYHGEVKQKLHFIGIPLSVAYKIAEWNRFQVYAAAGIMAEVNVAGKQQSKFFLNDTEISRATERIRMKEWLWSVNARAGVSYPLIRFVSAFAEVGAGYYFDNGSFIETIHSEKPFNVNFQLGFRIGF